ncbi:MAG TPA: TerC family protein [Paenalcaligenes sp.]|nr:TerC family protein [Paenalcaligenes sp.]
MLEFFSNIHWAILFQIILIDILLGGDNALVIALACRNLDEKKRRAGIFWGTFAAIMLRIILIFFALALLATPFLKIVGAALLIWIGITLLIPSDGGDSNLKADNTLWGAIKTILIADFVMSLDNVIAIAGVAHGTEHQLAYVIFGLLLSVPIIIWGSTIILKALDRYPIIILLGAGLLGWIAGGMLVADVYIVEHFGTLSAPVRYGIELLCVAIVIGGGKWLAKRQQR